MAQSVNNVSQPPYSAPLVNNDGTIHKAWAIWIRDMYRRVAFKGGNTIDINKEETDESLKGIDDQIDVIDGTLKETIEQVNENTVGISDNKESIATNTENIATNTASIEENKTNITTNSEATQQNATNLTDHEQATTAHGSNGAIVGFNDVATETLNGLVMQMANIADAVQSAVEITQADPIDAPAAYSQTHAQSVVDLTKANKAGINQLVSDFNDAVNVLNQLLANSKTSGQMNGN